MCIINICNIYSSPYYPFLSHLFEVWQPLPSNKSLYTHTHTHTQYIFYWFCFSGEPFRNIVGLEKILRFCLSNQFLMLLVWVHRNITETWFSGNMCFSLNFDKNLLWNLKNVIYCIDLISSSMMWECWTKWRLWPFQLEYTVTLWS
jgi:hypothetical protein